MLDSTYDAHSRERFVAEQAKATAARRGAFERDRARVLHSAALRRLAAKTQVVGVGQSDFPRTRLTHSLECAQIGRELAAALGADPDLVDTACLAHDLGHPPFGHNGETALAEFAAPCGGFEGNAQSLRVLTRLEAKTLTAAGTSAGLNLTRATLDAATKYPWPRREGTAKFGMYDEDRVVFTWMRDGVAGERRCIEAQIMDWADDVAYSVHDLEDGIHAGHVDARLLADDDDRREVAELAAASYAEQPVAALEEAAARLAGLPFWPASFDGSLRGLVTLKQMTSELIARFSSAAVAATRASYGDAALTRYAADLVVPAEIRAECAILKAVADRYVMSRQETRLVQARDRERLIELATTLLDRAPDSLESLLRDAWTTAPDDAARRRVVVDQVASLTDTSAVAWWERWAG
jgi:dGTPase